MIELLVTLLVIQYVIVLYLIITGSEFLASFLDKLPSHPIALDIFEEDQELCLCGLPIEECKDAYEHMTSGV